MDLGAFFSKIENGVGRYYSCGQGQRGACKAIGCGMLLLVFVLLLVLLAAFFRIQLRPRRRYSSAFVLSAYSFLILKCARP